MRIVLFVVCIAHTFQYDIKSALDELHQQLCGDLILRIEYADRIGKHVFELFIVSDGVIVSVPDEKQAGKSLGKGDARLRIFLDQ